MKSVLEIKCIIIIISIRCWLIRGLATRDCEKEQNQIIKMYLLQINLNFLYIVLWKMKHQF